MKAEGWDTSDMAHCTTAQD